MLINPDKTQLIFGLFFLSLGIFAILAKIFKIKKVFNKAKIFKNLLGERAGEIAHFLLYGFVPTAFGLHLIFLTQIAKAIRAYYLAGAGLIILIIGLLDSFFRKKNIDVNLAVFGISSFLLDDTNIEIRTPFKQYLKQNKLDYSLESLKIIDDYLEQVRKRENELKEQEYDKVILRCGAYCGEVMRRQPAGKNYQWITEEEAIKKDSSIKNFAYPMLTTYGLYDPKRQAFAFPMAKVAKFLQDGRGESLYFYAKAMLAERQFKESIVIDYLPNKVKNL